MATATRDLACDVDRASGWLRVGVVRGAAIGIVTPPVCALVGVTVALAADPEPLPAGTTTVSTQTPLQALVGLVFLAIYVGIAASVGSVVGAAVGAATGGISGALDVASARRLPPWLLAGAATLLIGWIVQAMAIGWIPTTRPLDPGAERAWRLAFACPFVLGLLSLLLLPLSRTTSAPHEQPAPLRQ